MPCTIRRWMSKKLLLSFRSVRGSGSLFLRVRKDRELKIYTDSQQLSLIFDSEYGFVRAIIDHPSSSPHV